MKRFRNDNHYSDGKNKQIKKFDHGQSQDRKFANKQNNLSENIRSTNKTACLGLLDPLFSGIAMKIMGNRFSCSGQQPCKASSLPDPAKKLPTSSTIREGKLSDSSTISSISSEGDSSVPQMVAAGKGKVPVVKTLANNSVKSEDPSDDLSGTRSDVPAPFTASQLGQKTTSGTQLQHTVLQQSKSPTVRAPRKNPVEYEDCSDELTNFKIDASVPWSASSYKEKKRTVAGQRKALRVITPAKNFIEADESNDSDSDTAVLCSASLSNQKKDNEIQRKRTVVGQGKIPVVLPPISFSESQNSSGDSSDSESNVSTPCNASVFRQKKTSGAQFVQTAAGKNNPLEKTLAKNPVKTEDSSNESNCSESCTAIQSSVPSPMPKKTSEFQPKLGRTKSEISSQSSNSDADSSDSSIVQAKKSAKSSRISCTSNLSGAEFKKQPPFCVRKKNIIEMELAFYDSRAKPVRIKEARFIGYIGDAEDPLDGSKRNGIHYRIRVLYSDTSSNYLDIYLRVVDGRDNELVCYEGNDLARELQWVLLTHETSCARCRANETCGTRSKTPANPVILNGKSLKFHVRCNTTCAVRRGGRIGNHNNRTFKFVFSTSPSLTEETILASSTEVNVHHNTKMNKLLSDGFNPISRSWGEPLPAV